MFKQNQTFKKKKSLEEKDEIEFNTEYTFLFGFFIGFPFKSISGTPSIKTEFLRMKA